MDDYLNIVCSDLGIKLIYNKNEILVLSTEVKEEIPILRVHQVFKGCSAEIAQSIIDFYTNEENSDVYEKNIVEFLKNNFPSNTFKIKPLNVEFKDTVKKNLPSTSNDDEFDSALIEHDIDSIITKDFFGRVSKYDPNLPLKLSDNDLLEVNIIVKPPVT